MNFKQAFFRIYDRKIGSGEISFSETGIDKKDFTRLCTEEGFVFDEKTLEKLCQNMRLTPEEKELLYSTLEEKV